ncbi:EF-hand domain-containing protein [Maribacter sp. X9]|uniref:EF-hand domain-containing protein n=1 Tax=Maribacter sp. X9 TaxID=3402159 RepID=UPI003AF405E2
MITDHFDSPQKAFNFFDADHNQKLIKSEIVKLLKKAEISGFTRGGVSSKLTDRYGKDGDERLDGKEFKADVAKIKKSDS